MTSIFTTVLGVLCYYSHFIDEETEVWGVKAICPILVKSRDTNPGLILWTNLFDFLASIGF